MFVIVPKYMMCQPFPAAIYIYLKFIKYITIFRYYLETVASVFILLILVLIKCRIKMHESTQVIMTQVVLLSDKICLFIVEFIVHSITKLVKIIENMIRKS